MRQERSESNPIRCHRARLGLSREKLAVQAGVCTSTVYLAERAGLVTAATAVKLAAVLGVAPDTLLATGARRGPAGGAE